MTKIQRLVLTLGLLALAGGRISAAVVESDVCVYGGTSGGVVAAVAAAHLGQTVSLAVYDTHLGGLTSGGLGATDVGTVTAIGGMAREFYRRIGRCYGQEERFDFEPHVAAQVFADWLREAGVTPHWRQRLATVTKSGTRITEIRMEDGTVYRAKMFIDATYEGDLMAQAGVSFTFGREGTNVYDEPLNGVRASTPKHQFDVAVDPYIIPGNSASGLLPFIQPGDGGTPGAGDRRIQAFNYRLCFTQNPTNRLPHVQPPDFDPARYELLGRLLDAWRAAGKKLTLHSFFNITALPNGKTDMNNNGPFSTDFIGMNWTYPTNDYAAREKLDRQHREYIQGMIWYLLTSPRAPETLRDELRTWGPCRDEWPETGGYSPQIYVREARRLLGEYMMTQADCAGDRVAPDSLCLGSYNMDSHNCQRVVQHGVVRNEGDVQVHVPRPYPIAYRAILPRRSECENLLVPLALSASHIAFGSIRMEPVFMMLGQGAGTAAALADVDAVSVQQLSYARLAAQLTKDGALLHWQPTGLAGITAGIIVDNAGPGVSVTGDWQASTATAGFLGRDYWHDANAGKGEKSVTFVPQLPRAGRYQVALYWPAASNRASNVPVDVNFAGGLQTVLVDETREHAGWVPLLTTNFDAGTNGWVRLRTTGTTNHVITDAVRWLPVSAASQ
ncbi:MAG TPA: FAD-dependent oxidoreductase [Dongiaceae bacterium]|nr:FAD-dependent oxidoreductase [Dongiaceae bacterium]